MAIGVAQMERIDETLDAKRDLARRYAERFEGLPVELHRAPSEDVLHTYWMVSILVPDGTRDRVMAITRSRVPSGTRMETIQ